MLLNSKNHNTSSREEKALLSWGLRAFILLALCLRRNEVAPQHSVFGKGSLASRVGFKEDPYDLCLR